MTDLPDGEWSPVLVGHQWPAGSSVAALGAAATSRGAIEAGYRAFGDRLQTAIDGPLVEQEGVTADDIRAAFRRGRDDAQRIAESNRVKREAYGTARDALTALRGQLTEYAGSGNREIEAIRRAKGNNSDKVPKIVAVIAKYQAQADHAAGAHAQTIMSAAQRVVEEDGAPALRDLANANGIELGRSQKPEGEHLEQIVQSTLKEDAVQPEHAPEGGLGGGMSDAVRSPASPNDRGTSHTVDMGRADSSPGEIKPEPTSPRGRVDLGHAPRPTAPEPPVPAAAHAIIETHPNAPNTVGPTPQAPVAPGAPATPVPGTPGPAAPTAVPSTSAGPGLPQSPATSLPQTPTAPTASSAPVHATAGPDLPVHSGAPMPMSNSESVLPAMPAHQSPVAPAQVATPPPVLATHTLVEHALAAEPQYQPVGVAAPPQAAPPVAATAPPVPSAPPVSALPGYGADLRPAAVVPSAAAAPVLAAPSVSPAGPGHAGLGQPAVVRTSPPSPATTPATYAATTATAAVGGAEIGRRVDRHRLRRLANAMALQQSRLCWAVGDKADGTTLVVTDLADGWLPPGIEIPATATVLTPQVRRGGIDDLLGAVVDAAVTTPSTRLPEPDPEAVNLSTRPLRAPEVAELGWEICRATQWRDGLPRLAHTLARAAVSGTGVPDNEITLLRECLAAIAEKVLAAYPRADREDIANWQLLAAIEALVDGHRSLANYHLAWFLAPPRPDGPA
ncbi:MAG: DUF5631 domain-containing protein [Mycolicibacterium sp.]|nr:DUF5631 domain-containing protein [Mycolicibacterium sp.]